MNRQYSVEMLQISAHQMLDAMFSLQFQYVEYVQDSNYCNYCELNILRFVFMVRVYKQVLSLSSARNEC